VLRTRRAKLNISAPYRRIEPTLQIISPGQDRLSTTFLMESALYIHSLGITPFCFSRTRRLGHQLLRDGREARHFPIALAPITSQKLSRSSAMARPNGSKGDLGTLGGRNRAAHELGRVKEPGTGDRKLEKGAEGGGRFPKPAPLLSLIMVVPLCFLDGYSSYVILARPQLILYPYNHHQVCCQSLCSDRRPRSLRLASTFALLFFNLPQVPFRPFAQNTCSLCAW